MSSVKKSGNSHRTDRKVFFFQGQAGPDLDRLLLGPTNNLVDEHNKDALERFPGRKTNSRSTNMIQQIIRL